MKENYGLLEIVAEILELKVTTEGKEKPFFCWLNVSFSEIYCLIVSITQFAGKNILFSAIFLQIFLMKAFAVSN